MIEKKEKKEDYVRIRLTPSDKKRLTEAALNQGVKMTDLIQSFIKSLPFTQAA